MSRASCADMVHAYCVEDDVGTVEQVAFSHWTAVRSHNARHYPAPSSCQEKLVAEIVRAGGESKGSVA